MKILVTHPLDPQIVSSGLGELVSYRPELATLPESELLRVLKHERPGVVLTDRPILNSASLTNWNEPDRDPTKLVYRHSERCLAATLPTVPTEQAPKASGGLGADLEALGIAERRLLGADTAKTLGAFGVSPGGSTGLSGERVVLVGAGIVNLMTARELLEQGADVEIVDAGPDPRSQPPWQELGATHGGADARMYCYTEADNYNEKAHRVYAQMREVFRQTITEGGWLVTPFDELTPREEAWIEDFLGLPRWRAEVFTRDIHRFNITSGGLWDQLKGDLPELFDDVGYTPGVLRVYSQAEKVEAAKALHGSLGSLQRALDSAELKRRHPGFAEAVDGGEIAGGLEIRGFTLGIHRFARKLLAHLEQKGARFQWRRRVTGLERDSDGAVQWLRTADGPLRAEHYVLSPGAYCQNLLAGTASDAAVQGILGLWLFLPHLEPRLERSVKIHREGHVGEDSNITVGRDGAGRPTLILGSGYGFLGERSLDMDSPEIRCLFQALEVTARRYLPTAYDRAMREGTLYGARKACVRPFTSTGLGIFEVLPTAEGGRLVITTGHNTGGFTQAPVVAEAVRDTLGGCAHPMQSLYRPDRGRSGSSNPSEDSTPTPRLRTVPTPSGAAVEAG